MLYCTVQGLIVGNTAAAHMLQRMNQVASDSFEQATETETNSAWIEGGLANTLFGQL